MQLKEINRIINAFARMEIDLNQDDFKTLFGDNLGDHLWSKFDSKYNRNMVDLWLSLDYENRDIVTKAINHYLETKGYNDQFEVITQ